MSKIVGIASLLENEPSTSHRSENCPSPRSTLCYMFNEINVCQNLLSDIEITKELF